MLYYCEFCGWSGTTPLAAQYPFAGIFEEVFYCPVPGCFTEDEANTPYGEIIKFSYKSIVSACLVKDVFDESLLPF